jgi:hypothetical protein
MALGHGEESLHVSSTDACGLCRRGLG